MSTMTSPKPRVLPPLGSLTCWVLAALIPVLETTPVLLDGAPGSVAFAAVLRSCVGFVLWGWTATLLARPYVAVWRLALAMAVLNAFFAVRQPDSMATLVWAAAAVLLAATRSFHGNDRTYLAPADLRRLLVFLAVYLLAAIVAG